MGNLKGKININKKKSSAKMVQQAKYNRFSDSKISRVFFKTDSFSETKGIKLLEDIYKANHKAILIFTGGGFFRYKLPITLCKLDYNSEEALNEIKKYIEGQLKELTVKIETSRLGIPLFLGIDFYVSRYEVPIQLAVLFRHKMKYHIFSKRYPVAGEKIIKEWLNFEEVVFVKGLGKILPLVCNDGVLWGGRSEKTLSKASERTIISRRLKRRFKAYKPKLMLDFIHRINSSSGKSSGRIFSSSIKNYNERFRWGLGLGAFGSEKKCFLKRLASSGKIPMKIKNLSGNAFEDRVVSDFYIY